MVDTIAWNFSNDLGRGTHAFALGFLAYGPSIPIKVLMQDFHNDVELTQAGGYTADVTLPIQATTQVGLVCVHLTGSVGTVADLDVSLGGVAMTVEGATFQTAGNDAWHAVAYLWIGDGEALADHVLTISMAGLAGPDVDVALAAVLVEGIEQGVGLYLESGTLNAFTRELTIDPDPSAIGVDFVFSGGAQALDGSGATSLIASTSGGYTIANQAAANDQVGLATAWCWPDVSYNCDCGDAPINARTLADIRADVLSMTGYAAQVGLTLPPGVERMYNNFIRRAQGFLYTKFRAMETRRFFSWELRVGGRFYGIYDNKNDCVVTLNRYRITGAWIQDLNNTWWPLRYGIDPVAYTLNQNFGWPTNFEVRQCIELFPAPQAPYRLWIRGEFDLLPLEDDDDSTTINAEPITNYATFLAKAHKGMKDAALYEGMAEQQIGDMIAGAHATRRYIPGTIERPIPTPPVMIRYVGSP